MARRCSNGNALQVKPSTNECKADFLNTPPLTEFHGDELVKTLLAWSSNATANSLAQTCLKGPEVSCSEIIDVLYVWQ
jgi:hypothetical protein